MSSRNDESCIQKLLDGMLGEREFARVEKRISSDDGFRAHYLSAVRAHHLLIEKFSMAGGVTPLHVAAAPVVVRRRRVLLGMAATLVGLLTVTLLMQLLKPAPRATFVLGPESKASLEHPQGKGGHGHLWVGSTLDLERGSVSIEFPNGTRGYIEGPGKLQLTAANSFRLHAGRAWFGVPRGAEGFVCATNSLVIKDLGTEFGIIAEPGQPEEVHVIEGKVLLHPLIRPADVRQLVSGEGTAWKGDELTEPARPAAFSNAFPEKVVVFSDDFDDPDGTLLHGKAPDAGAGPWQVLHGDLEVRDGSLDTRGQRRNAAFAPLAPPHLDELTHILLLTVEAIGPGDRGWAGVSLYTGDQERIFVGDPDGPDGDWALHPAGAQAINASPLLAGKSTVTLRYNFRSGLTELFEGTGTTGEPLASQWIAAGLSFDRIRLANGSQYDAIIDAGGSQEEADAASNVRSNIAVRKIEVTALSAANATRSPP